MLSDVITSFGSVKACSDLIPGIVGEGAAREFAAFVRNAASIKQIEAVIADPQGAPLPKSLDGVYVLTSWLAHNANKPEPVAAAAVLLHRLSPEFAVVLARDKLKARPAFAREPLYRDFMKAHASLFSG
jgi:hypothetical protein